MVKTRTVTKVEILDATITIIKGSDGKYTATLAANGELFTGKGLSIRTATDDVFRTAMDERRERDKGAPTMRSRVARSVL